MDDAKLVEVEFERNASRFRVWVRDQGPGFDWNRTADPRDEQNLVRTSGRGIFFMKSFVDSVTFENLPGKGTQVLLEKKLEASARGQAQSGRQR
jgi:serine/threonine-protein kinase RsbW